MNELLPTVDAAALLNVSPATMRWWRHTGQGPKSFKLGPKKVMYRKSDVVAWLEEQYAKANVPA